MIEHCEKIRADVFFFSFVQLEWKIPRNQSFPIKGFGSRTLKQRKLNYRVNSTSNLKVIMAWVMIAIWNERITRQWCNTEMNGNPWVFLILPSITMHSFICCDIRSLLGQLIHNKCLFSNKQERLFSLLWFTFSAFFYRLMNSWSVTTVNYRVALKCHISPFFFVLLRPFLCFSCFELRVAVVNAFPLRQPKTNVDCHSTIGHLWA